MSKSSALCAVLGVLLCACKKKEEASSAAAPATSGAAATEAAASPAAAEAAASASKAEQAIKAKNWDAVVTELVQLTRQRNPNEEQGNRLRQLNQELLDAAQSDPKAMEALQTANKILNGR